MEKYLYVDSTISRSCQLDQLSFDLSCENRSDELKNWNLGKWGIFLLLEVKVL
jgi:hypothetical protein